jgi:hypothetical protein
VDVKYYTKVRDYTDIHVTGETAPGFNDGGSAGLMYVGHNCALGITEVGACRGSEEDMQLSGLMCIAWVACMRTSTHIALIHQNRCREKAMELVRVC